MAVREELKNLLDQRNEVPKKFRSEFNKKIYEYPENFEEALFVLKEIQNDSTLKKVLSFIQSSDQLEKIYDYSKNKETKFQILDFGVNEGYFTQEYLLAQVYDIDLYKFQEIINKLDESFYYELFKNALPHQYRDQMGKVLSDLSIIFPENEFYVEEIKKNTLPIENTIWAYLTLSDDKAADDVFLSLIKELKNSIGDHRRYPFLEPFVLLTVNRFPKRMAYFPYLGENIDIIDNIGLRKINYQNKKVKFRTWKLRKIFLSYIDYEMLNKKERLLLLNSISTDRDFSYCRKYVVSKKDYQWMELEYNDNILGLDNCDELLTNALAMHETIEEYEEASLEELVDEYMVSNREGYSTILFSYIKYKLHHQEYFVFHKSTLEASIRLRQYVEGLQRIGLKHPRKMGEVFNWPEILITSSSSLDISYYQHQSDGPFKKVDYKVGKNGYLKENRRRDLDKLFKFEFEAFGEVKYQSKWGYPATPVRLKYIVSEINKMITRAEGRWDADMSEAISDWKEDKAYLKRTYYVGKMEDEFVWE